MIAGTAIALEFIQQYLADGGDRMRLEDEITAILASPGFLVRGLGNPDSLESASHGAGRVMSRRKAALLRATSRELAHAPRRDFFVRFYGPRG